MLPDKRSRSQVLSKGQMQQSTRPPAAPAATGASQGAFSKQPAQSSSVSSKACLEPNIDSKVVSAMFGASEKNNRAKPWASFGPMPLTALVPCWAGSLCMGTAMGYSLPAGRSLHEAKDRGSFNITHAGIFWFGSLMSLGAMFGSLTGAMLAQRYGRRWSFLTAALGLLATWLCIGLAQHVYLFYVARFINGFFIGLVSLVVPAHIAEMALVTHRGTDGAMHHLVITLGMLYAYAIGLFLDWSWLALCCVLPPLLLLLLTWLVVESPRWLLERHKSRQAFQALLKVRTTAYHAEADVEFDAINAIFTKYKTPPTHFMMAVLVMAVQQASGVNCIVLSATSIAPTVEAMNSLVLLVALQSIVSLIALPLLDLVGRRNMIIMSVIVCSTSLVSLGFVYYTTAPTELVSASAAAPTVQSRSVTPPTTASTMHRPSYLTFAIMAFFVVGYSVGLGPVPWILAAELVPLRQKGIQLGSVCAANWASSFVTANFFATASTTQLFGVMLWLYCGATVTGGLFFLALLPETASSSIEEILLIGQELQHERSGSKRRSVSPQLTPPIEEPTTVKAEAALVNEPPQPLPPPRQSSRPGGSALGPVVEGAQGQPRPQSTSAPGSSRASASSRRSTASKSSAASKRMGRNFNAAQ